MVNLKKLLTKIMKQTPIGTIQMYGGTTAPEGWLLCNGAIKNISEYPALAAILGTNYGGDGTTTFGLPDMSGRMPIGVSSAHPISGTGSSGGDEDAVNISHTHTLTRSTDVALDTLTGTLTQTTNVAVSGGAVTNGITGGSHKHNIHLNSSSGSTSGYGLTDTNGKYAASGARINNSTHNHDLPSHTHTVTQPKFSISFSGHSVKTQPIFTCDTRGADGTGLNMPPYRTVNFIIYAGI